jgi:DNA-directed RNA polymerase alpha subunit
MPPLVCPHCKAELDWELSLSGRLPSAPDEPSWRTLPVDEMEISVRASNALRFNESYRDYGCKTAGDIDDKTDRELLRFSNFGKESLREVRAEIERLKAEQEPG